MFHFKNTREEQGKRNWEKFFGDSLILNPHHHHLPIGHPQKGWATVNKRESREQGERS